MPGSTVAIAWSMNEKFVFPDHPSCVFPYRDGQMQGIIRAVLLKRIEKSFRFRNVPAFSTDWHMKCFRYVVMLELVTDQFPIRCELKDETPCSIRLMNQKDEPAFRDFHSVIPEEEQLFIRSQIKDGTLFREWMTNSEEAEHLALLAHVDGQLAAMGSLHQRLGGWKRHIGKVYFLTHPEYRGLGLIDQLLGAIVDVAGKFGLTQLESELNGERKIAIDSLGAVGFNELVRIPNYIRDMRAQPHDYVLMGKNLVPDYENLGTGD